MAARDDGESIGIFEPLIVSEGAKSRARLDSMANSVAEKSAQLLSSLPPAVITAFADVMTVVNCYYSNLIEGHDLDPIHIERALRDDFSDDAQTSDLQMEARAHCEAQKWIDMIGTSPFTTSVICETHNQFYKRLPLRLRTIQAPEDAIFTLEPGMLRDADVRVGSHIAISPGAVPRFLARLERGYKNYGRPNRLLAAACGHHRLLWIHPFADGNGRIARLLAHAALRLETAGVWSVSRGLAIRRKEYITHLASCDEPRRGSLDGRGTLSEGALADFAEFFLKTCIAEIEFVGELMRPFRLRIQAEKWVQDEMRAGRLVPGSDIVLTELLLRGELGRSDIPALISSDDISAERLTTSLKQAGLVRERCSGGLLQLSIPIGLAMYLLPGLLPQDRPK